MGEEEGYAHEREKNPAQNPRTTPRTMASCSRAMSEPRTSGGLISAMYKGESMLKARVNISKNTRRQVRNEETFATMEAEGNAALSGAEKEPSRGV